jgi:adenosylcobinamide kinase / adenosylcobinamide-phosphate guanylyltransferase
MGVILYAGGCRSGKSRLALETAHAISERVCFIATCVPQDDEMHLRVKRHQEERPENWLLIEEPVDLVGAISRVYSSGCQVILVDCLTLWLCNLMCKDQAPLTTEQEIAIEAEKLIHSAIQFSGDVIFVSSEVGMGIMPDNAMSRSYIDMIGQVNQIIARGANKVVFVSCGIGMTLKPIPE